MKSTKIKEPIIVEFAPAIPGLVFRGFRGEEDYPKMLAVLNGCKDADGIERSDTLEELVNNYEHLTDCDPYTDMLFAEIQGEVVAYSRVFWYQEENGPRNYTAFGFLLPAWRRKGIGSAMLNWGEDRLRQIATGHPHEITRYFQSWTTEGEKSAIALLEKFGYQPVRYGYEMVRDLSESFPEAPMPEGLEVRPVKPEHMRAIWDADVEAFRDHWGYSPPKEEDFQRWLHNPLLDPSLYQVAWDGEEVAGMVQNFINQNENEEYERQRGYTEGICVRRPWRKRGLAKSLIVQSMRMFKEMGFTETALGVDAENTSGALNLYKSCGYKVVKKSTTYRKEMDQ
jgi:ribosomal protein S18 acetylase RimI-like enzyme